MSEKIPIVCGLNDKQLQERRKNVLDKAAAFLLEKTELPDGFRYRFPAEEALLQDLIALVKLERKCCSFLNFKLILEAGSDFVSLELTGEEGAKEAVQSLFNWN